MTCIFRSTLCDTHSLHVPSRTFSGTLDCYSGTKELPTLRQTTLNPLPLPGCKKGSLYAVKSCGKLLNLLLFPLSSQGFPQTSTSSRRPHLNPRTLGGPETVLVKEGTKDGALLILDTSTVTEVEAPHKDEGCEWKSSSISFFVSLILSLESRLLFARADVDEVLQRLTTTSALRVLRQRVAPWGGLPGGCFPHRRKGSVQGILGLNVLAIMYNTLVFLHVSFFWKHAETLLDVFEWNTQNFLTIILGLPYRGPLEPSGPL